jgi:hypothetical protein
MTVLGVKSVESPHRECTFRHYTHGKGCPGVRLTRVPTPSGALTVALLLSGQPAVAADNAWGGGGWQRQETAGYEAGYDAPRGDSYGWGVGRGSVSGGYAGQRQNPTWEYGGGAPPPSEAVSSDQYSQYRGVPWDQGVIPGPRPQVPPGGYLESGPVSSAPTMSGWRTQMDYRSGYGGYVFRPLGQPDSMEPGGGPMWSGPGSVDGVRIPEVYPGFRFRGDAGDPSGQWSSVPYAMGFRFRPLTDQERDRFDPGTDFGRGYPRGPEAPSMRGEAPIEGGMTYGFEPNPWRGR